ncbi:macro domain-containing protein [Marinobacter arenosus]|uniref:macro domain-containing protein n=1 Tax=Marinobacter arenosus TaxID=2856822 RepID=UPI0028AA0903|nr:macro domain-containing protein [Marinobacter arenosus]
MVKVEIVRGNIASQPDIDAVVNAANTRLMPGSGVAGAIHSAAGPGLAEECQALAPIAPGQAVITSGHRLPNRYVIHCLGPVYGVDEPSDQLLGDCYRNALMLADQHQLSSLAFPAISTGVFGYPVDQAADVAFAAIAAMVPTLRSVQRIRLVLFSAPDYAVFEAALNRSGLASTD